jgi:hypothetical protein
MQKDKTRREQAPGGLGISRDHKVVVPIGFKVWVAR